MISTEFVYGINPVIHLLMTGSRPCHEVLVSIGRKESDYNKIEKAAKERRLSVKVVSRQDLANLVKTDKHQGVAVKCDTYRFSLLEDVVDAAIRDPLKGFLLILDGVSDPQNLGALVRTANLMGVHGVVIPKDNACGVTPTVVKASAGATEHQKIVQVTNIANTINYLKEKGFWIVGAAGETDSVLYKHDFGSSNVALILGSEGKGMRRLVRESCDHLLSIPMSGSVGSFNVSTAGAIFMNEVARQRWISHNLP